MPLILRLKGNQTIFNYHNVVIGVGMCVNVKDAKAHCYKPHVGCFFFFFTDFKLFDEFYFRAVG